VATGSSTRTGPLGGAIHDNRMARTRATRSSATSDSAARNGELGPPTQIGPGGLKLAEGKAYVRVWLRKRMAMSKPPASTISSLKASQSATIEATVTMLEAIREIDTRDGTKKKVRNGKVKDASGEIALVLWGAEVEMVVEGDKVRITDGWVKDYQGKPQISLGRSGKLEKV
jgi:hypothetical protein